jgi:hypothetical protein
MLNKIVADRATKAARRARCSEKQKSRPEGRLFQFAVESWLRIRT